MRIVIEGPNGAGKSTLAKTVSTIERMVVAHAGPAPNDDIEAISNCMSQISKENCVWDRLTCISRQCYEQPTDVSVEHETDLNRILGSMKSDTIFVFCVGGGEYTKKPYYTDEHWDSLMRDRDRIVNNYEEIFKGISHFRYDFRVNSVDEVIEFIHRENEHLLRRKAQKEIEHET